MNKNTTKNDYSMFEVIPLEDIDFDKYGNYSIVYDKGIAVRYMIIHEAKLLIMNRKTDIDRRIGRFTEEEIASRI